MATTELKDDATHEEVLEVVDQIIHDVEEAHKAEKESPKEEKGDAQKIAEDRDKPVTETTTAETESGSDDTADNGDGDDEKSSDSGDQAPDWLDDELRAEVAALGIDEKEVADFTSRDELERALRFFDRSALEAGRKAMAEGDESKKEIKPAPGEQEKAVEKEPEKKEPKEGQYEIKLANKGRYDDDLADDLVEEFTGLRDHYESRFNALEARFTEAEAEAGARADAEAERHFDSIVDSLGHADLFGKSGKEKPKELQRRQDLHVAVRAQQIGLQTLGHSVELDKSLVNRVARMVFTEDLGKKDLKARTREISKQSNGRMGGGNTRAPDVPETAREEAKRHYAELEKVGSA